MNDVSESEPTASTTRSPDDLAIRLIDQVDEIVREAEQATKPLEIDPYRSRLFELFVTAEGAGLVEDGADNDLSADGLCHQLSDRWGLRQAATQSLTEQSNLSAAQLQKMRSLWSVMRMWMEWTYAWSRWDEFHGRSDRDGSQGGSSDASES